MRDEEIRVLIHRAVDHAGKTLSPDPYLAQRILRQRGKDRRMNKKLTVVLAVALALLLMTATALAAALLTPREVVEQVAVPAAQSNEQENYTYEELASLVTALNENGITLDEGSRIMQAFQAGRGYWERETIEEICFSAFGRDQGTWTLEQRHWYGEMMTAIGAWKVNVNLLPGEGDLSLEEAGALAVQALRDAYGVELPTESDENWLVGGFLERVWDEKTDSFPPEKAEWQFNFSYRRSGSMYYSVTFGRAGQNISLWREALLEKCRAASVGAAMDEMEYLEGSCAQWPMETWAKFGALIRDMTPDSRSAWLYQRAGYRLPPEDAVSPEKALETAREATGAKEGAEESILCCMERDRPIYKVCRRVRLDGEQASGRYGEVWCVEVDCATGKALDTREYVYGPDSDPMMMYAPFSILEDAPAFEKDLEEMKKEEAALARAEKEAAALAEYGAASMFFLPLEKQAEVFGGFHTVPSREEYEKALAIAQEAIAEKYGADALETLGDYKTGVIHQVNGSVEDGAWQHVWDFMFTTDPEYLSDGFRVQFRQPVYPDPDAEAVRDLTVEHAGLENG